MVGWLVSWLVDWLVSWLGTVVGWLVGRLVGWLVGWFVRSWVGRWFRGLISWLVNSSIRPSVRSILLTLMFSSAPNSSTSLTNLMQYSLFGVDLMKLVSVTSSSGVNPSLMSSSLRGAWGVAVGVDSVKLDTQFAEILSLLLVAKALALRQP